MIGKIVIKYKLSGQEVRVYQEVLEGRYLISDIYESEVTPGCREEQAEGEVYYFDGKLYDKPPTEKLNEDVVKLRNEILELGNKKIAMRKDITATESEIKERISKITRHEKLKRLEDYLDGKITHIVKCGYCSYNIVETKDLKDGYDGKEIKLITMYGSSKGDILWKANEYKDGSGSWMTIIPCLSYDEAVVKLKEAMLKYITEATNKDYTCDYMISSAKKYGIELPKEYLMLHERNRKESISERILRLEKEITEQRQKLNEND